MASVDRKGLRFHRSLIVIFFELAWMTLPLAALLLAARLAALRELLPNIEPIFLYRCGCAVLMIEFARRYLNDIYIFGPNRITHFHGRFSLRLRRTSICYSDIREVAVRQTLLGRFLDYGTLLFGTAAKDIEDMLLADIPQPHRLAAFTEKLIGPKEEAGGAALATRQFVISSE